MPHSAVPAHGGFKKAPGRRLYCQPLCPVAQAQLEHGQAGIKDRYPASRIGSFTKPAPAPSRPYPAFPRPGLLLPGPIRTLFSQDESDKTASTQIEYRLTAAALLSLDLKNQKEAQR